MERFPGVQYTVKFKDLSGVVGQSGVVVAQSPREAIFAACNRVVAQVVKYGSWSELKRAALAQIGNCMMCEVSRTAGGRNNFYIVYFRGF